MSENIITISELDEIQSVPGTSFIPVDNGTTTNKISVDHFVGSSNQTAQAAARLAQSYAKGGTNTRVDEDTDNAKYYKEQAAGYANTVQSAIAEVSEAVTSTVAAKNAALASETAAAEYARISETNKTLAGNYATTAANARTQAGQYRNDAQQSATIASSSAAEAMGYKDTAVAKANEAAASATSASESAAAAAASAEAAADASVKTPYIGSNGNWLVWDDTRSEYVDSGRPSRGAKGDPGEDGSVVSVTQTLQSGTKIAEISVDGTTTNLYAPEGGGGASSLSDLTDTDISTPAAGDVLVYDGQKWENADVNIEVVKNTNIFNIPDGEYTQYGLNIKIKDNVITLNSTSQTSIADNLYIKLTNGVEIAQTAPPSSWQSETVDFLEVGKTYGYRNFILGGAQGRHGTTGSCRDASGTSVISHAHPLVTLNSNISWIQLFVPANNVIKDLQYMIYISMDSIPTDNKSITAYKDYWKKYISEFALTTEHFIDIDISSMGLSTAYTQGMCDDGAYFYVSAIDNTDDTANTLVSKYLISDGTLVDSTVSYSLGHCNSMTYCKDKDRIYCIALTNTGTVHVIKPDLTYVRSFDIDLSDIYSAYTGIGAISYNASRQEFVCLLRGDRKGYAFFDVDFNFKGIVWTTTVISQLDSPVYGSLYAADNFIYQVIGKKPVAVVAFTYNGKYVGQIILPNSTDNTELEDITFVDGYAYLNVNKISGHTTPYVQKMLCEYTRWANTL